jgi:hypothetical protein
LKERRDQKWESFLGASVGLTDSKAQLWYRPPPLRRKLGRTQVVSPADIISVLGDLLGLGEISSGSVEEIRRWQERLWRRERNSSNVSILGDLEGIEVVLGSFMEGPGSKLFQECKSAP